MQAHLGAWYCNHCTVTGLRIHLTGLQATVDALQARLDDVEEWLERWEDRIAPNTVTEPGELYAQLYVLREILGA